MTKLIKYANYLNQIFMNINVNIRLKTTLVENLRWYTFKITGTLADIYFIFKKNLVPNKKCDIAI